MGRRSSMAKRDPAVLAVPMEDFSTSQNIMVYGLTGAGKTTLAASLPSATYLSAEPGIIAAKRAGSTARVVHIPDWQHAERARTAAQDGQYGDSEWLIVDTVSTIQQKAYRYWTEKQNKMNPKYDEDIPDLQGHQKVQFMTRRWVADMVDIPQNVLFLAHAMLTENNDGSGVWLPSIDGQAKKGFQVAQYCMGLMNAVGFMAVKGGPKDSIIRRILWQQYEDTKKDIIYTAKDQYSVFGRYTDDVSMVDLARMIDAPTKGKKSKK
jgi:hypothetical protein